MELGRLGVWASMDSMTAAAAAAFAKRVEGWGYAALWLPESRGRNVLVHSSWLLANTERLIVATGIANIYARDAMAMANGQRALAEQSGGRFLLGVGVSHRADGRSGCAAIPTASRSRRCAPISKRCARRPIWRRTPPEKPLTIVAALGPRMMALSAELADGAHPYNTTAGAHRGGAPHPRPRQTAVPGSLGAARNRPRPRPAPAARQALSRTCSSTITSTTGAGSALATTTWPAAAPTAFSTRNVAWGDEEAIRKRIQEHWDAGADHVCIQSIAPHGSRQAATKNAGVAGARAA